MKFNRLTIGIIMPKQSKQTIPMQEAFKTGELAVYPAHGVAMITGVESRQMAGESKHFYMLRILDTDAVIMVPIDSAANVGLRKIVKKSMLPKIYEVLQDKNDALPSTARHGTDATGTIRKR